MKTRDGFVSNSSSSSFAIKVKDLTATQIAAIMDHVAEGKRMGEPWVRPEEYKGIPWGWTIKADDDAIRGGTIVDNFNMAQFLEKIGVPSDKIEWGSGYEEWIEP